MSIDNLPPGTSEADIDRYAPIEPGTHRREVRLRFLVTKLVAVDCDSDGDVDDRDVSADFKADENALRALLKKTDFDVDDVDGDDSWWENVHEPWENEPD